MSFTLLPLSIDSLLAAFVLSAAVRPRHYLRLAAWFGACDMTASALAPALDVGAAGATAAIAFLLLLSGTLVVLDFRSIRITPRKSVAVYVLPVLLAVDNLRAPGADPGLAGLVSCAMAAGGFALGAAALRRLVRPAEERRWLGASFIACGLLLTL